MNTPKVSVIIPTMGKNKRSDDLGSNENNSNSNKRTKYCSEPTGDEFIHLFEDKFSHGSPDKKFERKKKK